MKPEDVHQTHDVREEGILISDPICQSCHGSVYSTPERLRKPCVSVTEDETLTADKLLAMMENAKAEQLEHNIKLLEAIMACGIRVQYNDLVTRSAAMLVVGSDFKEAITAIKEKANAPGMALWRVGQRLLSDTGI
jgi:hypothetical protein